MANDIPTQVLSDHFQERLANRQVLGATFLTFEFDPGFFEQEVLPPILDVPVSHAEVPRLLQLENTLRELQFGINVFYDWSGLKSSGDYAAPRLNIRRIPVRIETGVFHPKIVLILIQDRDSDDSGCRAKSLLVGCLSANLTRSGWWENVEVCHVEELEDKAPTILRKPLLELLDRLRRFSANSRTPDVLEPYRAFIYNLQERSHKSYKRWLSPNLYVGGGGKSENIAEFLAGAVPADSGYCLEILSPFFDKYPRASPLFDLIERIKPKETRIMLPMDADGSALCSKALFNTVRDLGATWGRLPEDMLQLGRAAEAGRRTVHAKVYRIFKSYPKREFLFVGSANLTAPGHSGRGGNLEVGILVQVDPPSRPDFWLRPLSRRPTIFRALKSEESESPKVSIPVQIRFSWKDDAALGRWDAATTCPKLELRGQGPALASGLQFPTREWIALPREAAAGIKTELKSLSILTVRLEDGREGKVLVQEEDMDLKPELLRRLPVRDILQYWSLLKPEQRQAFLESRATLFSSVELGGLMAGFEGRLPPGNDMFTRCAGVFHAFATLETRLSEALPDFEHQAAALLFGERFDSLGTLLSRLIPEDGSDHDVEQLDLIDRYLVFMSAQQLWNVVSRRHQEFIQNYPHQRALLCERLAQRNVLRDQIVEFGPPEMGDFLDWFDRWFMSQMEPVERS